MKITELIHDATTRYEGISAKRHPSLDDHDNAGIAKRIRYEQPRRVASIDVVPSRREWMMEVESTQWPPTSSIQTDASILLNTTVEPAWQEEIADEVLRLDDHQYLEATSVPFYVQPGAADAMINPNPLFDVFNMEDATVSPSSIDPNHEPDFSLAVFPAPELEETSSSSISANCVNHDPNKGSNSESAEPTAEESHYDTFLVLATATSSFTGRGSTKQVPVSVKCCGDLLKLSFQDTEKYAGIIKSTPLITLLREFYVKLNAVLIAPETKGKTLARATNLKINFPQDCTVRIAVYGRMVDQEAIGTILGESALYLQCPLSAEYDPYVPYHNPHYLLRPGSQMPLLDMDLLENNSSSVEQTKLDKVDKERFLKLFDEADGSGRAARVEVSPRLHVTLQRHQLTALSWLADVEGGALARPIHPLWETTSDTSSLNKYRHTVTGAHVINPRHPCGGILADEMGLGKTLSILALICWSLDILDNASVESDEQRTGSLLTTLIVTPKSTIHNWHQQCERHIHPGMVTVRTYHGSNRRNLSESFHSCNIVITTYATMRQDWVIGGPLSKGKWHRVVLDEAHHIRTRSSQTFKAACAIQAQYRWCLTGTPIHNSLDDYASLLAFIGVSPFLNKRVFDFWVSSPIKAKNPDGLPRLRRLIKATCLRRTKKLIETCHLPHRQERIEWIDLTPRDRELYKFFQRKTANIASGLYKQEPGYSIGTEDGNILSFINILRLICDHGEGLLPQSAVQIWKKGNDSAIAWEVMQAARTSCDVCGAAVGDTWTQLVMNLDDSDPHITSLDDNIKTKEGALEIEQECPKCMNLTPCGDGFSISGTMAPSPKVKCLIRNIRREQASSSQQNLDKPVKSVVFSCWTKMLDLTQQALEADGFFCQRIDGQKSLEARKTAIDQFNNDSTCTILLASLGSAGEGIDLTAANNVHLLEPHWNPMVEAQAVDRVHRIGQTREVLTTRYLTRHSIETYVQWVQKDKLRLISQSLDCEQISQLEVNNRRLKLLQQCLGDESATEEELG